MCDILSQHSKRLFRKTPTVLAGTGESSLEEHGKPRRGCWPRAAKCAVRAGCRKVNNPEQTQNERPLLFVSWRTGPHSRVQANQRTADLSSLAHETQRRIIPLTLNIQGSFCLGIHLPPWGQANVHHPMMDSDGFPHRWHNTTSSRRQLVAGPRSADAKN